MSPRPPTLGTGAWDYQDLLFLPWWNQPDFTPSCELATLWGDLYLETISHIHCKLQFPCVKLSFNTAPYPCVIGVCTCLTTCSVTGIYNGTRLPLVLGLLHSLGGGWWTTMTPLLPSRTILLLLLRRSTATEQQREEGSNHLHIPLTQLYVYFYMFVQNSKNISILRIWMFHLWSGITLFRLGRVG